MINIKEKEGKIIFNDTQEFNQDNLLIKYRNDEMTKKLLESQLKKLTEEFQRLDQENKLLKAKYPNKAQELAQKCDSVEDLLKEVGVKCL